jgi:hypothetical protein
MLHPVSSFPVQPTSARSPSGRATHAATTPASDTPISNPRGLKSLDFCPWHERLFVTPAELIQLTGCRRRSNQIAQLMKMKIPYMLNDCDEPVVLTAALLQKIGIGQPLQAPAWESNYKPSSNPRGKRHGR